MQEVTAEKVEEWKAIYDKYRARLYPNKKTASEIIQYLRQKYPVTEQIEEGLKQVVLGNVMQNKYYSDKLPKGKAPAARVFYIENTGQGRRLYKNQDDVFKGHKIIVGVELETAFFIVEGSSVLWDELFAFAGLDENDLDNFYLVAEYITCLKKLDLLDGVLTPAKEE